MHAFLDEGGVGAAVLQLRSRWDPARRVQAVVGEASIRDGAYISDDDQHIRLEGVYVEPTGMLAMLGESRIASAFADANATARRVKRPSGLVAVRWMTRELEL